MEIMRKNDDALIFSQLSDVFINEIKRGHISWTTRYYQLVFSTAIVLLSVMSP